MYAERPSRPEDVERIQLLERDNEMKDALVQKTMARAVVVIVEQVVWF
jgi:hypothetical protein